MTITDQQKQQYQDEGYFVLENVIPDAHLQAMRAACQQEIDKLDAEMDRQGVSKLGINHRGSRYFLPFLSQENQSVRRFIFSDGMADICRATIGPEAFLFLDQYVVKAAEKGMSFSWHQDEGYIPYPNPPYVGCWCALDDVTEENGTIYVLPYSQAGTKTKITHVKDPETNDMVGYFGQESGIPVIAPAGSIAVFSQHDVPSERVQHDRQNAPRLPSPVFRRPHSQRHPVRPPPLRRAVSQKWPERSAGLSAGRKCPASQEAGHFAEGTVCDYPRALRSASATCLLLAKHPRASGFLSSPARSGCPLRRSRDTVRPL